jgi:uncharacterized alkaline shock family protein YloU
MTAQFAGDTALEKGGVTHPGRGGDAALKKKESSESLADRPARLRGSTFINDDVVAVISRIAAERIPGVHQIGESAFRTVLSRWRRRHGVEAEIGMEEAAADIELVVEFGHPMRDVAQDVREHVIEAIESMTGRRVVEVNVFVTDVHVPKSNAQRSRRELK